MSKPAFSTENYKTLCDDGAQEVEAESIADPDLMERREHLLRVVNSMSL